MKWGEWPGTVRHLASIQFRPANGRHLTAFHLVELHCHAAMAIGGRLRKRAHVHLCRNFLCLQGVDDPQRTLRKSGWFRRIDLIRYGIFPVLAVVIPACVAINLVQTAPRFWRTPFRWPACVVAAAFDSRPSEPRMPPSQR